MAGSAGGGWEGAGPWRARRLRPPRFLTRHTRAPAVPPVEAGGLRAVEGVAAVAGHHRFLRTAVAPRVLAARRTSRSTPQPTKPSSPTGLGTIESLWST